MVSLALFFWNPTKACVSTASRIGGWARKGGEKKANERREKSMLLAFQRDDSTGFTKSPQHRQHCREMGGNVRVWFLSVLLCKLCMPLYIFVSVCVNPHWLCWYCCNAFQDLVSSISKTGCEWDIFLCILRAYWLHHKTCTSPLVPF